MPTIDPPRRRVAPQGTVRTRATGDDFGAGVGRAMGAVGESLESLAIVGTRIAVARRDAEVAALTSSAQSELLQFQAQLAEGAINPDGSIVPPPDPAERLPLWEQRVEEITERVRDATSDDNVFTGFQSKFMPYAQAQRIPVESNALAGQLDRVRAVSAASLNALVDVSAFGDETARQISEAEARQVVAGAVTNGAWSREDGLKAFNRYRSDVDAALVRRAIRDNPDMAIVELQTGEKFSGLDAARREQLIDIASRESERRMRAAESARATRDRETEAAQKERREEARKNLDRQIFEGTLTASWVSEYADDMDPADLRYAWETLRGGQTMFGDIRLASDLRARAASGEDVRDIARQALTDGVGGQRIDLEQYGQIITTAERGLPAPAYNSGLTILNTSLKTSDTNYNPAEQRRLASALDDYTTWYEQQEGTVTPRQAREYADQLATEYLTVRTDEMAIALPAPEWLTNGRALATMDRASANASLAADQQATREALATGAIDDNEYRRRIRIITDWARTIERRASTQQQKEPSGG